MSCHCRLEFQQWCNAGDKRVKRKRGSKSAAAVAARMERGYLKRLRTAGSTATPEERKQMAAAIEQLNARPKQQETAVTILTQERESLSQQVPGKRVRAGVVDTRVIGEPDQFDGDPMKYADWSFNLRSYLGAVDQRYQHELTTTETSSTPRLNTTLGSEESALSTQMYYILVMTTAGAALDKCHNAGVNEGFEDWRQFVMEWEPELWARHVGLLMNVLGYRFRDDIPTKLAAFERTVHDYENQSTKTVDDDTKIGVTMLGMEDMRVKEHLIRNSGVRITSWKQMREEILEITPNTTVHRQSTDANAARSESEEQRQGQRQQRQRQRQGRQGQRQGQGCKERIVQESIERRSEKVLQLPTDRPREGRVQKATERPCRGRRKPVAASPHQHDTAAVVPLQCLLPGERHTSTFGIAMPCANSEKSCEFSSEQAVRSLGAGSIALAETQQVRPIAPIPSNETGASIFQEVLIRVPQTTLRWHQ